MTLGIILLACGGFAVLASAETVRMKSGATSTGTIVKEDENQVVIDIPGWHQETLARKDIEAIEPDQSAPAPAAAPASPPAAQPAASDRVPPAASQAAPTPAGWASHTVSPPPQQPPAPTNVSGLAGTGIRVRLRDGREFEGILLDEMKQELLIRLPDGRLETVNPADLYSRQFVPRRDDVPAPSPELQRLHQQQEPANQLPTWDQLKSTPEGQRMIAEYMKAGMAREQAETYAKNISQAYGGVQAPELVASARQNLADAERQHGPNSREAGKTAREFADILQSQSQGQSAEAAPLYDRAFKIFRHTERPDSSMTTDVGRSAAGTYYLTCQNQRAAEIAGELVDLEIASKHSPDYDLALMAAALRAAGREADARQAELRIDPADLADKRGEIEMSTALRRCGGGVARPVPPPAPPQTRGRDETAAWRDEDLKTTEQQFGPNSDRVAQLLLDQAEDFSAHGDSRRAEERYQRAIAIYDHALATHKHVSNKKSDTALASEALSAYAAFLTKIRRTADAAAVQRKIKALPPPDLDE